MSNSGYPPYGGVPPVAVITPTNQTGVLLIVTTLSLAFGLVSLVVRGYVRAEFSRSYGLDDIAIVVSFIFQMCQSTAVYVAIKDGLGKTLPDITQSHLGSLQKAAYASDILFVITLWLTKCSMTFLFRRLSADKRKSLLTTLPLGVALLGAVAVFLVALRCNLSRPWDILNPRCTNLWTRWQVVTAFDISTEVVLAAVPIFILYDLHMSLHRKAAIMAAFLFRLLVIIPAVLRLHFFSSGMSSSDPTLKLEDFVINTQVELSWAIIAATIPCMRPFMTATHTTWGGHGETHAGSKYIKNSSQQNRSGSGQKKSPLVSLKNLAIGSNRSRLQKSQDIQMMTNNSGFAHDGWGETDVEVQGGPHAGNAHNRDRSDQRSLRSDEQMMIRKDTYWNVRYEDAPNGASGPSNNTEGVAY